MAEKEIDISQRLPANTKVGGYAVGEWVAAGGMADVYSCYRENTLVDRRAASQGRYVAKVLRFKGSKSQYDQRRRLFESEFRILEDLSGNIHIITVFDRGLAQGPDPEAPPQPYCVMQRLTGGSLTDLIKERKDLSEEETIRIAEGLVDALGFAHKRHYLHCDVKPDNVMLDESNNPVWIDFGIAKELGQQAEAVSIISEAGAVAVGTAPYMSPEHFIGRHALCPQSDIWSMGVLMMRMLTRMYPFGMHFEQVRQRTLVQNWKTFSDLPAIRLGRMQPKISPEMRAIIVKCLQVELDTRYHNADQLKADLSAVLKRQPLIYANIASEQPKEEPRTQKEPSTGDATVFEKPIANDKKGGIVPKDQEAVLDNANDNNGALSFIGGGNGSKKAEDRKSLPPKPIVRPGNNKIPVYAGGSVILLVLIWALISFFAPGPTGPGGGVISDSTIVSELNDTTSGLNNGQGELVVLTHADSVARGLIQETTANSTNNNTEQVTNNQNTNTTPPPPRRVPVTVQLVPVLGYSVSGSSINGQPMSADGLAKPFQALTGQTFSWKIKLSSNNEVIEHSITIPANLQENTNMKLDWKSGDLRN